MSGKCRIHIGRWVCSTVLVMSMVACDDALNNKTPDVPSEKGVPVELSFGFANEEDGYTLAGAGNTRSENALQEGGFSAQLIPNANTRATADLKPDALYELHVIQYRQDGTRITTHYTAGATEIGIKLTYNLTSANDCQLVIVARGKGNTSMDLNGNLANTQKQTVAKTIFENIPTIGATQDQINTMPYVLHLEHVNVTSDGKLQSIEGAHDARLLLKRLATKLTVNWSYNVAGYKLKQVLLQSIPLNFTVVDKPDDNDGTYPSLVSQFTTFVVSVTDANATNGSYSCWVPANVRGESAAATSDLQRTKANAPTGSAFLNFVAVNTTDSKKKLDYRVYVGSGASTDFNMHHNKDYVYQVDFNHTGIPTSDRRVTYIDPIPASESNDNLVPTGNCFMVAPGSAFCFDPFTFQLNNNMNNLNSTLQGWSDSEGGIASVQVLWQTRENGDVGDPILGVVNATTDHSNIVTIKKNDGTGVSALSPLTTAGQGRIYCRVASNTSGGNGMIAAYNKNNEIIWSWHIWVTDYEPDATGDIEVLEPTKRKLKFTHNVSTNQLPMMDRNLGAMAGYINEVPTTDLDKSRTNGLLYQWGRKEPFPSSFSTEPIKAIASISGDKPAKGMLNRYGPDGYSYLQVQYATFTSVRDAYKFPYKIANGSSLGWWIADSSREFFWGGASNATKTVYDPCPAGWKVTPNGSFNSYFYNQDYANTSNPNVSNLATIDKDGGFLCYYTGQKTGNRVYIRLTGYAPPNSGFQYIGQRLSCWMSGAASAFIVLFNDNITTLREFMQTIGSDRSDGNSIRCIQEKE